MKIATALSLTLAAAFAAGAFSGSAEADQRWKRRRAIPYDEYYGPPPVVRDIPGLRLFFGDYALSREEFDTLYGTDDRRFDDSYYEPEAVPVRPRKKPKPVTNSTAARKKPASNDATASTAPPAKGDGTVSTALPADSGKKVAAAGTAPTAAKGGMDCGKATSIVTGYGFTGVTSQSCAGKVYSFNATRDGKPFVVKLDSSTGELTEVKKLP